MKSMFILLSECAEQFTEHFQKQGSAIIKAEMKDAFTRFANDAIASVAFGLQIDSLKEKNNEFYLMGRDATTFAGFGMLQFLFVCVSPVLMKVNIKMGKVLIALHYLFIISFTDCRYSI